MDRDDSAHADWRSLSGRRLGRDRHDAPLADAAEKARSGERPRRSSSNAST